MTATPYRVTASMCAAGEPVRAAGGGSGGAPRANATSNPLTIGGLRDTVRADSTPARGTCQREPVPRTRPRLHWKMPLLSFPRRRCHVRAAVGPAEGSPVLVRVRAALDDRGGGAAEPVRRAGGRPEVV